MTNVIVLLKIGIVIHGERKSFKEQRLEKCYLRQLKEENGF